MGDPEADTPAIGNAEEEQTAQIDPAKQLDSDAWFAEFLSENAEKLERHNREAIDETLADVAAAKARHDKELEIAAEHRQYVGSADVQLATQSEKLAAKAEAAAAEAEAEAKRLEAEVKELYPIASDNEVESSIRHQQALALERAAEMERASQARNRPAEGASEDAGQE
jgi:hypothetical protein